MDCLFCKIAEGTVPSKTIYEDDIVKAFYDIDPKAPVHFLIIPKKHIASSASEIDESNSGVVAHIFEVAAKLAKEMKLDSGYRIVCNCGKDAGQTVQHIHFHVLAGRNLADTMG